MSWPTQIWDPNNPNADESGMAPYTRPADPGWVVGKDVGLPDDWQDYDMKVTVWDALDNPLYEVAAEANGINWTDFKTNVTTTIGLEDDYVFPEGEMVTGSGGSQYNKTAYDQAVAEWKADGSEGSKPKTGDFTSSTMPGNKFGYSGTSGSVYSDMQAMSKWLGGINEKSESKGSYGVIADGPQGSDYGISGDIWEHYGLDKPPEAPRVLDESFFSYKDSPGNYTKAETFAVSSPWIDSGMYVGHSDINYSDNRPYKTPEKGNPMHFDKEWYRATGELSSEPVLGYGEEYLKQEAQWADITGTNQSKEET